MGCQFASQQSFAVLLHEAYADSRLQFKPGNFDHACHLTVPFLSHVGVRSCTCMLQWLADRYQGPPREGSTKAGPRLYEPQGKRFTLLQGDSPSSRVFQYVPLHA